MTNKQLEHVRTRTLEINSAILKPYEIPEYNAPNDNARIAQALIAGKKLQLRPVQEIVQHATSRRGQFDGYMHLESIWIAPPIEKDAEREKALKVRASIAAKLEAKREEIISRCVDEEFESSTGAIAAYEREVGQFRKLT